MNENVKENVKGNAYFVEESGHSARGNRAFRNGKRAIPKGKSKVNCRSDATNFTANKIISRDNTKII